jgi:hypothetical protein
MEGGPSMKFITAPTPLQSSFTSLTRNIQVALGDDYKLWHTVFTSSVAFERVIIHHLVAGIGKVEKYINHDQHIIGSDLFVFGLLLQSFNQICKTVPLLMEIYNKPSTTNSEKQSIDIAVGLVCESFFPEIADKFGDNLYGLYLPGYNQELKRVGIAFYNALVHTKNSSTNYFLQKRHCLKCENWYHAETLACIKCDHPI